MAELTCCPRDRERSAEISRLRDELAALQAEHDSVVLGWQNHDRTQKAELAAKDARIAELEVERDRLISRGHDISEDRNEQRTRAERAEAELDIADGIITSERARAERAEAERNAMRELLDWIYGFLAYVDSYHSRMIRDKVRAALASSPAGPDGRRLAVIYCMERAEEDVKLLREALEGMIAVAEGRFDGNPHADIDALAKARVAQYITTKQ